MKRDMDLARRILFSIEDYTQPDGWVSLKFDNVSGKVVSYHVKLLYQAGLIEAVDLTSSSGFDWKAKALTWDGHEFIEAARDESRWKKAKSIILEKGGSLTFDLLKQVLSKLLANAVL